MPPLGLALGVPDISNDIRFYGAIRATITAGRNNYMPAQRPHLNQTQMQLLVAWLLRNAAH